MPKDNPPGVSDSEFARAKRAAYDLSEAAKKVSSISMASLWALFGGAAAGLVATVAGGGVVVVGLSIIVGAAAGAICERWSDRKFTAMSTEQFAEAKQAILDTIEQLKKDNAPDAELDVQYKHLRDLSGKYMNENKFSS